MTLQQCRYVVAISEHKTINRAAKALFVTQPTISKAISELELELGIHILNRNNKGITFTEAGRDVLFYASMLLEQASAMSAHFKAKQTRQLLQFSITSQHYTFAVEALAILVKRLAAPQYYEINFREDKSTTVITDVADGISELGIIALTDNNRLFLERIMKRKALSFHALGSTIQHVYLNAKHPLAKQCTITLEALKPYTRYTYKKDDLPQTFTEEGNHLKYAEKIVYLNDRATMDKLLAETDGYNIGTGCLARDPYQHQLRVIPLFDGCEMTIGYVTRRDVSLPNYLSNYVNALQAAVIESLPSDITPVDTDLKN
ncbi:LysR family transcriptional regulator [Fusibacter paucivorans]|uniref:LysR family transcriptional regulator n=1 Tax=Fusibacter paucivorans TaxID=76009 RepID=A0ABS5PM90_9FIRM|nr:LysR family transcriptional regulator [Fusibacter paucivorans]MBS7526298.1 LysR family transcriptional regulator [Fusibacter paucivorans]